MLEDGLTITTIEWDGHRVGAAPCVVSLFGGSVEATAVVFDNERWISTDDDCQHWLTRHGLGSSAAALVIAYGKVLAETHKVSEKPDSPELATWHEEHGNYWQEVGKIADIAVESLSRLRTKKKASLGSLPIVQDGTAQSVYTTEMPFMHHCLRYGGSVEPDDFLPPNGEYMGMAGLTYRVMLRDVVAKIEASEAYQKLYAKK